MKNVFHLERLYVGLFSMAQVVCVMNVGAVGEK